MKTTRTMLGRMFGTTFGMPMVILAITGTVTAGTVAGMARAARAMGPVSVGCQADDSGPSLKELISTLKGQSAAPRSEAKVPSAGATVAKVAGRTAAGTKVSSTRPSEKSTSAVVGTPVATKKAAAKAEPATTKKAATKKAASTTAASAKASSAKAAPAKAAPAKAAPAKKASAGSATSSSAEKKGSAAARPRSAAKSSAM